ncbi:hypothetical protein AGRA3207_006752 [Actinomadura graeca]|uniref:Ferric reductase n=1 Tax=Actinomadura graeca TaxID=2750812 RepID=A0ABX8R343_9ACTN|nr:hypothetical protein [Actinomadura graeca]QXJ25278.1 hypothetical protein AGRA3207_006752 [Actinomadura graeca]
MRTRNSDDPVIPSWVLRAVLAAAVLVLVGAATPPGAVIAAKVQYFLSFYAGVFTLLAMTAAVMSGLLATDRLILGIRHRVMAQGVHRASAVLAMAMVVAHIAVKVLGGLATPEQIVVPGVGPVGLGTLAFELMVLIVITGMMRARFAFRGHPWVWRSMHAVSYVSWPLAIVHGLTAGRVAANWVVLSYVMSVGGVALALLARMIVVVKPRDVRRVGDDVGERTVARERAMAADRAREHALAGERAAERDKDPRATVADPRGMRVPRERRGGDTEVFR